MPRQRAVEAELFATADPDLVEVPVAGAGAVRGSTPPGQATRTSHALDVVQRAETRTGAHPSTATRTGSALPSTAILLHVALMTLAGVAAAVATGADALSTTVAVGLVLTTRFRDVLDGLRPELPGPGQIVAHAAVPIAVIAVGSAFGLLTVGMTRPITATVVAALLADLGVTATRRRLNGPVRMLVIGCPDTISTGISRWSARSGATVVGGLVLDHQPDDQSFDAFEECRRASDGVAVARVGGVDDVHGWAERWGAELVVVLPSARLTSESLRTLGWQLERTGMSLAVSGVLDSVAPHRISPRRVGGTTVIESRSSVPSAYHRAAKWVFDRLAGALLLVVAAPALAVCGILIRLDSSGPSLFRQVRVGRDGREFTMLKLRTMRTDAESVKATLIRENDGNVVLFKMHRDPRITRIGRVLRKTSLDELPQLVNVVLGQMSLVGPRPALPSEVIGYDKDTHRRYAVRPGMTGLWQVSGRSDLSWEQSRELDLYYVDNYGMAGDLMIALRTVRAVVGSRGAY